MADKAILPGLGKLFGGAQTTAPTPSNAASGGAPTMGLFSALAKNMGKKPSTNAISGEESPSKTILKNLTGGGGEGGGLIGNKLELILN